MSRRRVPATLIPENRSVHPVSQPRITRSDLEDTFRSFQGGVTDEVVSRKRQIAIGVAGVFVLIIVITFLLGKRRGHRKTTFVEIRRF